MGGGMMDGQMHNGGWMDEGWMWGRWMDERWKKTIVPKGCGNTLFTCGPNVPAVRVNWGKCWNRRFLTELMAVSWDVLFVFTWPLCSVVVSSDGESREHLDGNTELEWGRIFLLQLPLHLAWMSASCRLDYVWRVLVLGVLVFRFCLFCHSHSALMFQIKLWNISVVSPWLSHLSLSVPLSLALWLRSSLI